MENENIVNLRLQLTRRKALFLLTAFFLAWHPGSLGSEILTMTTYYPAPYGGYASLLTTGQTLLARDGGNVGIGTSAPTVRLDVNGQLRIQGGSPGEGKVLTSDAGGLASWQAMGGGFTDFTMVASGVVVGGAGCSATVSCPPSQPHLVACLRETCGSWGGSNCSIPSIGLQDADWDATSCTASLGQTGTCCAEKCRARALCGAK